MNRIKSKIDGTSDYATLLKKYNDLVQDVPVEYIILKIKKLGGVEAKLKLAEESLNKVLDLINSNEDLAHFYTAKNEIRKPILDYFKGAKK